MEDGQNKERFIGDSPSFIGRKQQVEWFEQRLQEVYAGTPRLVLLPGEAGIGKTRLLQEVQATAKRRGMQVCYGRGYEDVTLPYLPFVDSLLAHLGNVFPHGERDSSEAQRIHQFVHQSGMFASPPKLASSLQSDQDKLELFLLASRAAIMLARRCPLVFVMDDLHWADHPSVELFGHLVYAVADTAVRESVPLMLIGAYRPVEPENRLGRLLARLQRETICHTCELHGFNEAELYELVRELGLLRPSHQLIGILAEVTHGNPLFAQEAVRHLRQRDVLKERTGARVMPLADDVQLPTQVTSAFASRIKELSPSCQHLLTFASVLGEHFALVVLQAVMHIHENELLEILEEAIHHRLLIDEGEFFRFTHSLIRHTCTQALSILRRQRLHHDIALTLEALYAENLDPHLMEIAHHLIRAGSTVEARKVVQFARQAGHQAFTIFAWNAAARFYEAALVAAEADGGFSTQDVAELAYWAGLACQRDQDVSVCLDHYEKAIEGYRHIGDIHGHARSLMGKVHIYYTLAAVSYGSLIDMQPLEEMLVTLGDEDSKLRGEIAVIMAGAYWTAKQTQKARAMSHYALEIGQSIQDDALCTLASYTLGLAESQEFNLQEALESWQNSLVYAQRINDRWLQGYPLPRIPAMLVMLGRVEEAEQVAAKAADVTRQNQDWGYLSVALSHLAAVAAIRGDVDAVEGYVQETMLMVYRSGYHWGGFRALLVLAYAYTLHGDWDKAQQTLDTLVEPGRVFQEVGPFIQSCVGGVRQLVQAHIEPPEEAAISSIIEKMRDSVPEPYDLPLLCTMVELGDLLGQPSLIDVPFHGLTAAVERGAVFSNGWMVLLPRVLGVAATLKGWWREAEAYFQQAIDTATTVFAFPELGRSYLDYARMLVVKGQENDQHRALELVQRAMPIFHEFTMQPFILQATQLAEQLPSVSQHIEHLPASLALRSTFEKERVLRIALQRTNFFG